MAERSYLWPTTGTGDGPSGGYPYTQVAEMLEALYQTGVLWGLGASASGFNVTIAAGKAIVQGVVYTNDAPLTLTVSNPGGGNSRRDLIVLRGSASARTVRAAVKAGVVNSGVYPALQQDASFPASGLWEVQIARVIVTGSGATLDGGPTMATSRGIVLPGHIAADAVGTAAIAAGAVDDTRIGQRVPKLTHRQGGNATDWGNYAGTTNYTLGAVRMQCGMVTIPMTVQVGSGYWGSALVTFPVAFAAPPLVFATADAWNSSGAYNVFADRCTVAAHHNDNSSRTCVWLAIGPG